MDVKDMTSWARPRREQAVQMLIAAARAVFRGILRLRNFHRTPQPAQPTTQPAAASEAVGIQYDSVHVYVHQWIPLPIEFCSRIHHDR